MIMIVNWKGMGKVKGKAKVVPMPQHYIMKVHMGNGHKDSHILNDGTAWR